MSLFKGSTQEGMNPDAPINIASIIDCFTVLITYVLAAASFLSLGVLDAGIAAAPSATTPPQVMSPAIADPHPISIPQLHLHLAESSRIELKGFADGQKIDDQANDQNILDKVKQFKVSHPTLKSITLSAADAVTYERVVHLVGGLKGNHVPVIFSGNPE